MWKRKNYLLEDIGIEGSYPLESMNNVSHDALSHYDEKEEILYTNKDKPRCALHIETKIAHGSYGNLYLAKRTRLETRHVQSVLIKQPRMAEMNLMLEGILQHISQYVLEKEGMGGSIPRVFDVFWLGKKVWFSMELIKGISVLEFFQASAHPDQDFFLLIAQISLILWCLEYHLGLDHRDLKINNLLVVQEPCILHFQVRGSSWTLHSPFRIVVLDFGFACLGSEQHDRPLINLGDGVLPPMDPCPKEGRDIFQLLTSLISIKEINDRLSKRVHDKIDTWLSLGKKSYGTMARRWSTENWTYLVASQRNFSIPSCCPENILRNILPDLVGFLQLK